MTYPGWHGKTEKASASEMGMARTRNDDPTDAQRAAGIAAPVSGWTHRGVGGPPSSGRPARGARVGQSGNRPHRGPDASVGAAVARALRPRSIERANRHAALRASRPLFPPKNVMMSCPWRVAPAPSCGARVRTGRCGPSLGPRCSGTSSVGSARAPSTDG